MAAALIRLSIILQINRLKSSVWLLVGAIFGALYGLFILVVALFGLSGLGSAEPDAAREWLALGGALLVIAWAVLPLLMTGSDQTMEPERFATLSIPQRDLSLGLFGATVATPGGLFMAVLGAGWGLASSSSLAGFIAGSIGGLLGASICLVFARWVTAAFGFLFSHRRFREMAMILLFSGLVFLSPIMMGATTLLLNSSLRRAAAPVVSLTPLGAPWLLGVDAAAGDWGGFFVHLGITVAGLGALFAAWSRSLARGLVGAGAAAGPRRARQKAERGTGIIGSLGDTPALLMASRSLFYWLKDPRYAMSLIIIPAFLGLSLVQYGLSGFGTLVGVSLLLGFLLAWALLYDTSMDSTAQWVHVAAGVSGVAERAGRVIGYAIVGLPFVLLQGLLTGVLTGSALRGAVVGLLTASAWAIAAGTGALISGRMVMPTTRPHENPFGTRQGGFLAVGLQLAGMLGTGLVLLPGVLMAVSGLGDGSPALLWAGVGYSVLLGAGALALGVVMGGRQYDRHKTELLEKLVQFDLG